MNDIYAQGDILIEKVDDAQPAGTILTRDPDGAMVLAEGEMTGHRHVIFDRVTMFRDDGLARGMPADLYIGHLVVDGPEAVLRHEEHSPIVLPQGTYRVRRQRELEPRDVQIVED